MPDQAGLKKFEMSSPGEGESVSNARPNPALKRTVNGGLARWFFQTWAAPLSAA